MLSKHEYETIRTISRLGGKVKLTMGRPQEGAVRTLTVRRLADRGMLQPWTGGDVSRYISSETVDLMITVRGCREFVAYEEQELARRERLGERNDQ